jgi:hypothetical protein
MSDPSICAASSSPQRQRGRLPNEFGIPLSGMLHAMDDDTSTSEGHFGNRRVKKYSAWASAVAIAITIIAIALVFYFRAKLTAL